MRTFVEIFIEHINKLITNQQVYDDVLISFQKSNETVHALN